MEENTKTIQRYVIVDEKVELVIGLTIPTNIQELYMIQFMLSMKYIKTFVIIMACDRIQCHI